jgi:flagellar basal-body rod protein FlgB
MISGTEAITTKALSLALDAATLRQQAIASNIANANAEGYIPLRVSFNAQFDAVRRSLIDRGRTDLTALGAVQMQLEPALDDYGVSRPVEIDAEVAALAQNTTHYQTLIRGLSRHLSMLASAVSEGKK